MKFQQIMVLFLNSESMIIRVGNICTISILRLDRPTAPLNV